MKKTPFAVREYLVNKDRLVATVYKPEQTFSADWSCEWEIEINGETRLMKAAGIDSLQALLMALSGLRADLHCRHKVKFLGEDGPSIDIITH
jgi:hypothetical protein